MTRAIPMPKISPVRRSLSAVVPKSPLMLASPVTSTSKSETPDAGEAACTPERWAAASLAAAAVAAAVRALASSRASADSLAMVKSRRAAWRSAETRTGEGSVV